MLGGTDEGEVQRVVMRVVVRDKPLIFYSPHTTYATRFSNYIPCFSDDVN